MQQRTHNLLTLSGTTPLRNFIRLDEWWWCLRPPAYTLSSQHKNSLKRPGCFGIHKTDNVSHQLPCVHGTYHYLLLRLDRFSYNHSKTWQLAPAKKFERKQTVGRIVLAKKLFWVSPVSENAIITIVSFRFAKCVLFKARN